MNKRCIEAVRNTAHVMSLFDDFSGERICKLAEKGTTQQALALFRRLQTAGEAAINRSMQRTIAILSSEIRIAEDRSDRERLREKLAKLSVGQLVTIYEGTTRVGTGEVTGILGIGAIMVKSRDHAAPTTFSFNRNGKGIADPHLSIDIY